MIIVDTAIAERAAARRPILFGLFGSGFMGQGIINQGCYTPGIRCAAVCNRTVNNAVQALKGHGVSDVEIVDNVTALDTAIERGATAVTEDPEGDVPLRAS